MTRRSIQSSAGDAQRKARGAVLRSAFEACHIREFKHDSRNIRLAFAVAFVLISGVQSAADTPFDRVPEFGSTAPAFSRATTWLDSFQSTNESQQIRPVSADGDITEEESDFDLSDFDGGPDERYRDVGTARLATSRSQFEDDETDRLDDPSDNMLGDQSSLHDQILSPPAGSRTISAERIFSEGPTAGNPGLCWQVLPRGLLYRTYMAGEKEPRMQFLHLKDLKNKRTVWDAVLGGRLGLLRYGTTGVNDLQGFQLDLEGAVFARVLPEQPSAMLEGSDYRVGMYGTWREDQISYRAGYYHISSHVGDEYLLANPAFQRINYVRDSLLAGTSYDLSDASRVYGEIGYALGAQGGAKPLEFQVGTEYTPLNRSSAMGAPFAGINGHFREDFDFQGGVNIVTGWGWQGIETKHRIRVGLNYYQGPSLQYEFFDRWENLVGGGVWVDY